jgi:hypothetical protein
MGNQRSYANGVPLRTEGLILRSILDRIGLGIQDRDSSPFGVPVMAENAASAGISKH